MAGQSRYQQAAQFLFQAHRDRRPYENLPESFRPSDIEQAYAMQEALKELRSSERGMLAGYKIALTTPVMQRMVGYDAPCCGTIFETGVHCSPARVAAADYGRLGAECEIAVRLDAGLPASGAPYDRAKVAEAVAAVMAAFELVDDRSADYSDIHFFSLVADNAWNAGIVLGPEVAEWRGLDLGEARGEMIINGQSAGEGHGRDVLGHPLDALAWLANNLAERGKELSAGMTIMTGSIVTTKFLNPGDEVTYTFEGLGEIALSVG
jgi:2-keto-4-pentenoate hydratase